MGSRVSSVGKGRRGVVAIRLLYTGNSKGMHFIFGQRDS